MGMLTDYRGGVRAEPVGEVLLQRTCAGTGEAGVGRACRRPRRAPGVRTAAARVYRGQLATSVSSGPMQGRGEPKTMKKNGKLSSDLAMVSAWLGKINNHREVNCN